MTAAGADPTVEVHAEGGDRGAVLDRLVDDRIASRIAAGDATIWGPDAEAEARIRLNWTDLAATSRPLLAEIAALRAKLVADGIDRVVLCGMGGSSLAPEVICRTAAVDLVVLDSTNPAVIARALAGDLRRTVVVVSSKSGGTVETDSQRRAFAKAFADAGIEAADRFVVVTDPDSPMEQLALDGGYRKVFRADPGVGGRYSALTAFGLVPAGLAGADIAELLDDAAAVTPAVRTDHPANPALMLAAVIGATPGRDKLLLVPDGTQIAGFADWAEQLIAESTGKDGTGVLPVAVAGTDAPELTEQPPDLTPAFLVGGPKAGTTTGNMAGTDLPQVAVCGPLGAQFLVWETAVAVAGLLQGIDPFNQPDVESAKQATRGLLEAQPEPEPPVFVADGIEVRGSEGLLSAIAGGAGGAGGVPGTLVEALDALTGRLAADGYLAVMAYADPGRDAGLAGLRNLLAARTRRPVTFGWGPRFLHSTGQYHKGGHPQGVFLQITCHEDTDVAIPDRPYTFGSLIAAQAAGDAAVLADRGRPVLRMHLTDPATGVPMMLKLAGS